MLDRDQRPRLRRRCVEQRAQAGGGDGRDRSEGPFEQPDAVDDVLPRGHLHPALGDGLHQLQQTVAVDVPPMDVPRGSIAGVLADVADHVVDVTVAVEVGAVDAGPPAAGPSEAGVSGGVHQVSPPVVEHHHRTQRGGQHQVEPAVAVDVGPQRRGDHADVRQARGDGVGGGDEPAAVVDQERARRRVGVAAGQEPGADEHVQVTVAIEVGGGGGARGFPEIGQRTGLEAIAGPQPQAILQAGVGSWVRVATAGGEQVGVAVAVGIEGQDRHVLPVCCWRPCTRREAAGGGSRQQDPRLVRRGAAEDLVVAITVEVGTRQARTKRSEVEGQPLLARFAAVGFAVAVRDTELGGDISQQRRALGGGSRRRADLFDRVDPIDLEILQALEDAAGPRDLEIRNPGCTAEPEVQDRLGRRKIAAGGEHLLHVALASSAHRDLGAEAEPVAGLADQANEDAVARAAVVAEDPRRAAGLVDHHVEITVPIQIREHGAMGDAHVVEAPRRTNRLEAQVTAVVEGPHRQLQLRAAELLGAEPGGIRGVGEHVPDPVGVDHVFGQAPGGEQIEVAVGVQVAEQRRPRGPGAGDPSQSTGLLEAPSAGAEEEGVAPDLPRPAHAQEPRGAVQRAEGGEAGGEGRPGRASHERVQMAVAVYVAEVDTSGEPRHVAHRLAGDVVEAAVAAVLVEPVLGHVVPGDVQVRPAVPVVVPPHHRGAHVIGKQACALGNVGEATGPIVVQEPVPPPGQDQPTADPRHVLGIPGPPPPHLHAPGDGAVATDPVGQQVEVEIAVAVVVGKRAHRRGLPDLDAAGGLHREPAPTVVQVERVGGVGVAHQQIEITVAVDVGERRAGAPAPLAGQARGFGHVLEPQGPKLRKQPVRSVDRGQIEVRAPVPVHVAHRHPGAVVPEAVAAVGGADVRKRHAGGRCVEPGEALRAGSASGQPTAARRPRCTAGRAAADQGQRQDGELREAHEGTYAGRRAARQRSAKQADAVLHRGGDPEQGPARNLALRPAHDGRVTRVRVQHRHSILAPARAGDLRGHRGAGTHGRSAPGPQRHRRLPATTPRGVERALRANRCAGPARRNGLVGQGNRI